MSNYWSISSQANLKLLGVTENGLDEKTALKLQEKYGPNILPVKKARPLALRFLDQFRDILILLLLGSAGMAFLLGEIIDSIAIMVIVLVNALIGFIQEYKAEQALAALKQQEHDLVKTYRAGKLREVDARLLVPGDVVLVEAGDKIPADCRILTSFNLKLEEAMLTGESLPVEKKETVIADNSPLGDQINMLFKGTAVLEGKARALVVRTGEETEIGRIAALLQTDDKEETPLQKEISDIGKRLTVLILGIAALVFVLLLFKQSTVIEALLTAIAIAVAAIPEGLPAIVAVVLSVGVLILAKKKTIVRTLKAVETLGAVRYLLTDKTGTLTWNKINVVGLLDNLQNEFRVKGEGYQTAGELLTLAGKSMAKKLPANIELLIRAGALCNSSELEFSNGEVKVIGDTTEGALLVLAQRLKLSYEEIRQNYQIVTEEPFSSSTKRMLVVVRSKKSGKHYLFAKGAPEVILDLARDKNSDIYREKVNQWASSGWRNLAFAWAQLTPSEAVRKTLPLNKLQFLGLVAQEDTVRKEAITAVAQARRAGIETIMITGDHRLAALSIARQTGIAKQRTQVINGDELSAIEDEMLLDRILAPKNPVRVFARVSPEQKLRIVNLLKDRTGEVIAVTGDGVNDAPSIKAANVGVTMGKSGSDVAKEVADIVLADDNYATLVTGIFRGRVIFDNLIKFIRYLLSCNIGEVVVVFLGTLFGQLHILLPIQILFVNLVTDSLPALALGFEKGTPGILERSPRDPRERILNPRRWRGIILEGVFLGAVVLGAFYAFLPLGFSYARTIAFLVLVVTQLFQALNSRDERETFLTVGLFGNPLLWGALILSFALTYLVTQTGYLSHIFKTEIITNPLHWVALLSISSLVLGLSGVRKLLKLW